MALYQPVYVIPDVRSGLGLGTVDATQGMTVSWHISGASAMTQFQITIYQNDSASTQVYTTGPLTDGCPAYGVNSRGETQVFSYTIPASALSSAGITNGNEYKLAITQWWSASQSVAQSSASVFRTRSAPTVSISTIGTGGVIGTRYWTFTGNYSQAQGDVLNWFRWQIAAGADQAEVLYDSGNISGTMDISCYYDGFFPETQYAVRLTLQTENGVEADTGWVNFTAEYTLAPTTGAVTAGCVGGTDAVLVQWAGIGYIPGVGTGAYQVNADNTLTLQDGASVSWSQSGSGAMNFAAPWSIVWKGTLGSTNADIFTVGQSGGDVTLSYNAAEQSVVLAKGGTTLVQQSGIINTPLVTAVLTPTGLYLRSEHTGGGLYPSETLYPAASRYPAADTSSVVNTYTLSPIYTQGAITSLSVGGYQICNFIEAISGTASAQTIEQAITDGTYTPGLNDADYMLADWDDGLNAGTLDLGGDTLQGYALYRRQGSEGRLVKVAETDVATEKVYDYGALSQQGPYTYYLFPVGSQTYIASPLASGTVMPCWWNWTLLECEETADDNIFTVLAAYRFRLNIETGAMGNNNAPNILQNFTPYPKIQLAPQNYRSSTLAGLIGAVDHSDGQPRYEDTIELRDAIYALSVSQNPLFLKDRKGDLFRVKVGGAISMQTMDATRQQAQTMTLPWVEVGPADGVSLYSAVYAGVQEPEGESVPQFYVDTSDATAGDANLRMEKTAYGPDGKIIGSAVPVVSGTTLIMPEGMVRDGQ